jgi:hypothetical protein
MPGAHALAIQQTKLPSAATKINNKINYRRRAHITIITKTPDNMEDQFDGTRGNDRSSQHSQRNEREYGHNNHHSSRPPSNGRAPQGVGTTIGTRTEKTIGRARPPTTTGARKMHSMPGAQRTRSLTAKPVSAKVIMMAML